jgi:transposase
VSHGSARTTFQGRLLIVQRRQAGWPQAHIAAAMGISRKCVKTWLDRYAAEGEAGLRDRTSRPHSTPTRTDAATEAAVIELRRTERIGPDEISHRLEVPARTVSRILARHGMPRLCMLDPITGQVIKASKTTAGATSTLIRDRWSTWTSRSSAASPTVVVGADAASW